MTRVPALAAALVATLSAPGPASACPGPCADSDRYSLLEVPRASIPADGVVALRTQRGSAGRLTDAEAAAYVSAVVRDESGARVAGTVGLAEGVVVWRPDEPLTADYISVHVSILNGSIDDRAECTLTEFENNPPTTSINGASSPAELTHPGFSSEVVAVDSPDLEDWVCCGESMPAKPHQDCESPVFDAEAGFCVAAVKKRAASASFQPLTGEFPSSAAIMRDSTKLELVVEGSVRATALGWEGRVEFTSAQSFEALLRVTSLIDGSTASSEVFHVEEVTDGEVLFDPLPTFDSVCPGEQPYHCVVMDTPEGQAWDPELCSPWPEPLPTPPVEPTGGDDETGSNPGTSSTNGEGGSGTDGRDGSALQGNDPGCGCRRTQPRPAPSTALLWLLGVVALRRRR